ncbi:ArsR family transcriptional regulator [Candidatus Bathyarchaeota archaeon]|nr:ArsR family transcriptional regulator [Candidatus Bathyarchaeota archaeon]MBS7630374.1 ArsR family transcriptional regulator [Candidatus Bathyarchaeota archaeon]
MRRDIIIIKDPEVAKLFADETRREILHNLRHHELSTADLAKILRKPHSSIIHHLKLLQNAGLVEETRVEKKRNLVQSYYRSTAKRFLISYSLSDSLEATEFSTWQKELHKKIMEAIEVFGIKVKPEDKEKVLELLAEYHLREQKALEEIIERQRGAIKFEKPVQIEAVKLLTHLKIIRDEEYIKILRDLDELLHPNPSVEGVKDG